MKRGYKGTRLHRNIELPTSQQLEAELKRERYHMDYGRVLRSTIYTLITVAAVAILVATLWMPVLKIYGTSMDPTLEEGNIVVSVKSGKFETGEIVAFYYNNKVLVKRVIASGGDWVDIDPEGNVFVNGGLIDEPYLPEKAYGECNIELPYQVPDGKFFVMGDHRKISVDSRTTTVGCVSEEQVVGKLTFCVWPLSEFGKIK